MRKKTREILKVQGEQLHELNKKFLQLERDILDIQRIQSDITQHCERIKSLLLSKGSKKASGKMLVICVSADSLKRSIETGRYKVFVDGVKAKLEYEALSRNVRIRPYKIRYNPDGFLFITSDIIEGDQNDFSFLDNIEIVQGDKA